MLDGVRDRLDLGQRTQELFRLERNWHPVKMTWWEQQGAMSDVSHVRIEQTRELYHFPITELHHNVPKEDRIRRLAPEFEGARVWWPTRLLKRRADGTWYDLVADFRDEYDNYPMVRHDDVIDCLADVKDPVVEQAFNAPRIRGAEAANQDGERAKWDRRTGF